MPWAVRAWGGGGHSLRRQKELFSRGSTLPKWAPQVPLFNVCSYGLLHREHITQNSCRLLPFLPLAGQSQVCD